MSEKIHSIKLKQFEIIELIISIQDKFSDPQPNIKKCHLCQKYKKDNREKGLICFAEDCPANKGIVISIPHSKPSGYSNGRIRYETSVCMRYKMLYDTKGSTEALRFLKNVVTKLRKELKK